VTTSNAGEAGYDNFSSMFLVFQSSIWWIDIGANIHVCFDINMFTYYQATRDLSIMMGNRSYASILRIGMVDLKFTSGKIVQLKNVQHIPSRNKNLVSGSLFLRDVFKVVLEYLSTMKLVIYVRLCPMWLCVLVMNIDLFSASRFDAG